MQINYCAIALLCTLLPFTASAQIVTWTDPSPNALTPFQNNAKTLADLAGSDIVLYSHPTQNLQFNSSKGMRSYTGIQFNSAAIVLHTTPQQIQNALTNYSHYVGLFPTIKKADTIQSKDAISQIKYKVSIPTPVKILNFNENVTLQHHYDKQKLTTLIIDSPIQYGISKMEWFALDGQRTLVTITQWNDLDSSKGFLLSAILKAMPEAKDAISYMNNAFVLEALNLRFNPKSSAKLLAAGQVATKTLSNTQYQHLTQISKQSKQPVTFVHPPSAVPYQHGNETLRFTTSYHYFNSPSNKSKQLLSPTIYQTLFPKQVKKVELIAGIAPLQDAFYQLRVGLGVINIPFSLRVRFSPITDGVDMYSVGGDIKYSKTQMHIQTQGDGSVWRMTTASKVDASAPFLLRSMRSLPYHDMLPSTAIAKKPHILRLQFLYNLYKKHIFNDTPYTSFDLLAY